MSNVDRDACRSLKPGTGKEWTGHPAKDPRQLLKDGKSQETWFRSLQKKLALRALCCLFYKAQFLPPRTPSPATSQEPSRSQHLKLLGLCCGDGEVSSQRKPRLGRRLSWESRAAEAAVQVQELRDVRCGTRERLSQSQDLSSVPSTRIGKIVALSPPVTAAPGVAI